MKRTYQKPIAEPITLYTEGMMAASYNNRKGNGVWHAPSRHGWDSDDWSQSADADDDAE